MYQQCFFPSNRYLLIFTFQPIVLGKCKSAVFMNDCRYALSDLYLLLLSQFSIQQQVVPQTGRYRVKSPFSATSLVLYLEVLSLHPLQLLLILSTIYYCTPRKRPCERPEPWLYKVAEDDDGHHTTIMAKLNSLTTKTFRVRSSCRGLRRQYRSMAKWYQCSIQ